MNIELAKIILKLDEPKQLRFFSSVKRLIRSRLKNKPINEVASDFGLPGILLEQLGKRVSTLPAVKLKTR